MRTAYKRNNYLWRCQKLIISLFLTEILNPALMVILFPLFFVFFLSGFSFTDTDNSQDSRGREGTILFHSTTSTRSQTFRHLFATLHVRWLSHIFNRNACIYQITLYLFPFCNLSSWFLTSYCILRNISQNTVDIWVTTFCEIFRKI